MIQTGILERVTSIPLGTHLTAAAAANDQVLVVDWVSDFDEAGGRLVINEVELGYTGCDDDTSTITLAEPLPAAAQPGDQVLALSDAGQPRSDLVAYVQIDAGEPSVPHRISTALEGRLTEETVPGTSLRVDTATRSVVGADDVEAPMDGAVVWNPYLSRRMTGASIPNDEWVTPAGWTDEVTQAVTATNLEAVIEVAGLYDIKAQVAWATNGDGRRYIQILVNDAVAGVDARPPDPASSSYLSCFATPRLEVGDVVAVQIRQTSGAALFLSTGPGRCPFSLYRVSV